MSTTAEPRRTGHGSVTYTLELTADQILNLAPLLRDADTRGPLEETERQLQTLEDNILEAGEPAYGHGARVRIRDEAGEPTEWTGTITNTYLSENFSWEHEVAIDAWHRGTRHGTHHPYRETELAPAGETR